MAPELLIVGGAFVTTALVGGSLAYALLGRESREQQRLDRVAASFGNTGVVLDTPPEALERGQRTSLEQRLATLVPKSPKEMNQLQRQLGMAGYHGYLPAAIYALAEPACAVLFALVGLAMLGMGGWLFALLFGAVGYIMPGLYLSSRIREYKRSISNGLADAIDLLIVCIEAGSGLDQSLVRASEELTVSYPQLASELGLITTEIRAGKPRLEAFKNFADRTKVEDVESLVAMLVQTDRFGTSVVQALRTQSEVLRTKRRQRAEEAAAKLGVKLVFPLVLCLFPALYVVILGPAVIQLVHDFFGTIAQ
jgi:tight adherence protein C